MLTGNDHDERSPVPAPAWSPFAFLYSSGAWLVLLVLVAATLWVGNFVAVAGRRVTEAHLSHVTSAASDAWQARLRDYEVITDLTSALFAASDFVSKDEWILFTAELLQYGEHPAVRSLSFVDAERPSAPRYVSLAKEGPGGTAKDPLLTEEELRSLRDLGHHHGPGAVQWLPRGPRAWTPLAMVTPVNPGANLSQQRGLIVAVLSQEALVQEASQAMPPGAALAISSSDPLAHHGPPADDRPDELVTQALRVARGNGAWTLLATTAPPNAARVYSRLVPVVHLAGFAIGTFAFVVIGYLSAARRRLLHLVEDLRLARNAAEAANESKSRFLANMSHEIRTPLNGLLGTSRHLLELDLSDEARNCASAIEACSGDLMSRIELILDFVKVEANQLELETREVSIQEEMAAVVQVLADRAHNKQVRLTYAVHDVVPHTLVGDGGRIRQILYQLVGNALKFTDQGEVRISASLVGHHDENAPTATLLVSVEDTGIGIDPAMSERIFAAFAMADDGMSRGRAGIGLGLTLCERLVSLLGGTIGCSSQPGQGSSFWFTLCLPVAQWKLAPKKPAPRQAEPAPPATGTMRLCVLVVEDNPINQRVTTRILTQAGHRVQVAGNGLEAVDAVRDARFDAILMDCQMPKMDGYEATRCIRNLEHGRDLPILALTAHALKSDRERCLDAGMDDYLTKPVSPAVLLRALQKWAVSTWASV